MLIRYDEKGEPVETNNKEVTGGLGAAIVLGLIALIVIAIYSIKILSMGFDVPECEKLAPILEKDIALLDSKELDFNEKTAITLGKYADSLYCPLNLNVTMGEGKAVNFYCIEDDQVNTPKIQPDKDGRI